MTKYERMKEIVKASPDFGKRVGYKMCVVDEFHDIKELLEENAELQEENKKWKDEWQKQVQKANDEGYARTLQTIQLTKAKELIKKLLGCLRQDTNDPETNYYVCKYMTEAEQFLKENK